MPMAFKKKTGIPFSVLHVIDNLNPGGTEKQCFEIANRTRGEDFSTHLLTLNASGPLLKKFETAGIPVREYHISGGFYRPRSLLQIWRIAQYMRKEKFDIVQTYGFYSSIPGILSAKIAHVPVVIAGKRDMNEVLPRHSIFAEKWVWRFSDAIVVNAKRIKDYLVHSEKIENEKIKVIYNGVDVHETDNDSCRSQEPGSVVVGMVANFREQKDHATYLEAAKIVIEKKAGVRFVLIGSGPRETEMKEYSKRLGLDGSVTFLGRQTGQELYAAMQQLSVSVLVSFNEGVPNVLLESMALGIPIIGNPSGGIPEIIEDGVNGFLIPYKRPDLLAEKILYLLSHSKSAEEMGRAGQEKAMKEFSYSTMSERFRQLYQQLLEGKGCRRLP